MGSKIFFQILYISISAGISFFELYLPVDVAYHCDANCTKSERRNFLLFKSRWPHFRVIKWSEKRDSDWLIYQCIEKTFQTKTPVENWRRVASNHKRKIPVIGHADIQVTNQHTLTSNI